MSESFSVIGKRLPREDAAEKVKGNARFSTDIQLPNMLEGVFLRSPYANAEIINIDTSKAEKAPGVKEILTYKDVPKVHPRGKFEYLLDKTMHCVGEEVALIAAVTREGGEEAIKLIKVDYKELPAVFDVESAIAPGAPLVHTEHESNLFHGTELQRVSRCQPDGWLIADDGDIDKGFAEADHIIEGTYETPFQHSCSPGQRVVVCQWLGERLTCWTDTAAPSQVCQDVASSLDIPQSNVRIIATYTAGGYCGKQPEKVATLAAILAKRTGRPVRIMLNRSEDFIITRGRPQYKAYAKVGVKSDGTLTALYTQVFSNVGRDICDFFIEASGGIANVRSCLYMCPNISTETCQVMTNTPGQTGMNSYGDTPSGYVVERLMDEAAEKLGMNPVQFRIKNCTRAGFRGARKADILGGERTLDGASGGNDSYIAKPVEWGIMGNDIDVFPELIEKAAARAGWQEKWRGWKTPVEVNGSKRKGIGIAIGLHNTAFDLKHSAIVKMNADGTANVLSSASDTGQGTRTATAQVVAEVLGMKYKDVDVTTADTMVTPRGYGNVASSGTPSAILSAKLAADDVKQKLLLVAGEMLEVDPGTLEAKAGRIYVKDSPEVGVSIAKVCSGGFQITGTGTTPPISVLRDKKTGKLTIPTALVATIAEVAVDTDTGQVEVQGIVSAHDCGRAINPQIIENQINMSLVLAGGWVLSEEFIIDQRNGVVLNPNLLDYKLLTVLDFPIMADVREIIVENPCFYGPFGAKGMSETATVAIGPAIANAVYNATGARIRGTHLNPQSILGALGKV